MFRYLLSSHGSWPPPAADSMPVCVRVHPVTEVSVRVMPVVAEQPGPRTASANSRRQSAATPAKADGTEPASLFILR